MDKENSFICFLSLWILPPVLAQFPPFGMTNAFNLSTQPTPTVLLETCGDAFSKFAFVPLSAKENHEVGRLVDFDGGPGWEPFNIISGNEKGLFKMDKEGTLRTAYQIFDVDMGDYPLRLASINSNMICTVLINVRIGGNASLFDSFTRNQTVDNINNVVHNAIVTFPAVATTRPTTTRLPVPSPTTTTLRTVPTTMSTITTPTITTTTRPVAVFTLPTVATTTPDPANGFANLLSANNSRILLDDFDLDMENKRNGSKKQFNTGGTPFGPNPAVGTFPFGPRCADPFLTAAVPADTPQNVLITKVTATYEFGVPVVYSIPDVVFDRFRVDPVSGDIFTGPAPLSTRSRQLKKGSVVPQTRSALEFRARATIPSGSYCETVIRVNVVPTVFQANPTPAPPFGGRNPPFFLSQNLNFQVLSCLPGSVIGRVEALDPDPGDRVQYAVDNPTSEVTIDASTGVLRVGSIPPSIPQTRQMTVRAIDTTALSATTLVIVNFQCRGNVFPTTLQFSQSTYQFVTTNCALGTVVGSIMVLGNPIGVTYQSTAPQEFGVDPSGLIRIANPTLLGLNFQRTVIVIATDNRGGQGQTTVNVIGRCGGSFGLPLDPSDQDLIDRGRLPGTFPPIGRPGSPTFFDSRGPPSFPPPLGAERNPGVPNSVNNFNVNPNFPPNSANNFNANPNLPPNNGIANPPDGFFNGNGGAMGPNPAGFPNGIGPFSGGGGLPPGIGPSFNQNAFPTGALNNPNFPVNPNGPFFSRLPNRQLDQPDSTNTLDNNRDSGPLRPVDLGQFRPPMMTDNRDPGQVRPNFPNDSGQLRPEFANDPGQPRPGFANGPGQMRPNFPNDAGQMRPNFPNDAGQMRPNFPSDPGQMQPMFPNTATFLPGSGQFDLIVKVPFANNGSIPDNRLMDGFGDLDKFHPDDISAAERQLNQKGFSVESQQDPEDPNAVVFSAKQLGFNPNSPLGQNQIRLPPNQMPFPQQPNTGANFPPFHPGANFPQINPFPVVMNPQFHPGANRPFFGPSVPSFILPNMNFPGIGEGRPDMSFGPLNNFPQNGPRPFSGPVGVDPSRLFPGPIQRPYGVGGQFTELTIQLPSSAGQTPPVFLTPLCAPPSTNFIGRVQAVDPDPVDRVSYFIWSTGGTDVFDVNAVTGEIRSRVALGLGTYNVDVAARDLSGRTAIMKLEITISPSCPLQSRIDNQGRMDNLNANPIINPDMGLLPDGSPFSFGAMGGPRFNQPNFRFSPPPFAPPRTLVGQIQASSSDGSRIVYSLTPAGPEFDIDLDGRLFALMPVDGIRNLQVTATDALGRSSATNINIVTQSRTGGGVPGPSGGPAPPLPICLHNDAPPNTLKKSLALSNFPVVNQFGIIRQSSKSGLAVQGATVITVDAPYEGTLPASLPSGTMLGEYTVTGGSGIYRWLPGSNSNFEMIGENVGTLQTRMTLQPGAYEYTASIKDNAGNLGSIDIRIIVRNPDFGESLSITPESMSPVLNRHSHDAEFHNLLDRDQTVLF